MTLPATPTPAYRVIGDDWLFRVQFTKADGTPLDLTGAQAIGADLYRVFVLGPVLSLTLGNGAKLVTTASAGTVDFTVPRSTTAGFIGQDIDRTKDYPNRLVPYVVDSSGRRITPQVVPILPEDGRTTRVVVPSDILPITIVVGDQGPAGPSGPANSLTIGSVTSLETGQPASATIIGTAPNQVLNLGLPAGPMGGLFSEAQIQAWIAESINAVLGVPPVPSLIVMGMF